MANKKQRQADERLANAKAQVKAAQEAESQKRAEIKKSKKAKAVADLQARSDYYRSLAPKTPAKHVKPISEGVPKLYNGKVIDKAEYFKLAKGDFRITAWSNGQQFDIPKRFKSCTKAQEWIDDHVK